MQFPQKRTEWYDDPREWDDYCARADARGELYSRAIFPEFNFSIVDGCIVCYGCGALPHLHPNKKCQKWR